MSSDIPPGFGTEEQYLRLSEHARRLVEFTDGAIELLPMPTRDHQAIIQALFLALLTAIQPAGAIYFAGLRLQVRPGKYREPDLMLLLDGKDPRNQNRFWLGADLVAEVVSEDDPQRDTHVKPRDYAEARIPEYWIVNPIEGSITVLRLAGDSYAPHGVFRRGERATSALIPGFSIDVMALLGAS